MGSVIKMRQLRQARGGRKKWGVGSKCGACRLDYAMFLLYVTSDIVE